LQSFRAVIRSPRHIATAIVVLGGIVTYAVNFPGSMEDDSFVQLVEGRTQSYSNWHPPVMSWLLGLSDSLSGPPAAWFVGFQMLLAFGALAAVLWLPKRVSWAAVPAAVAMLFLPQFFLLQAVVWKDALFANAVLAGFVCLGHAAMRWERERLRIALLAASALFLALAVLTRQNGIVIVPCAAVALFFVAWRREDQWKRAAGYGAALAGLCFAMAFAGNAALQLRADGYPARQEQFKILRIYDITGMVYRDLDMPLTVLEREAPRLAHLIRTEGVARWTPIKNDTLELSPRIVAALDATSAPVLARQWRELVVRYPWQYLAVRALLFRWVFQPPDVGLCHPFHVGDQGGEEELSELGIQPRLDARDVMLWHYGDFFQFNTPVFSHALWAAAIAIFLVPLIRRRNAADLAIAGLIAAAAVFTATFFVVSIACDYRYLYLVDLTALAGALYAVADWPRKRGPEGPL
jgi:hypothetical protein